MQPENIYSNWKKDIILFMSGQAVSLFGSAVVEFALVWHITLVTKSGVMMTIGTLCVFLPRLIISLFAGVWADRHNRKLLVIFSDAGIAFFTLLLAIAFLSGYQEFWLIFVILGIRSIGTGMQTPAVSAIIPQIVPSNKLMRVNGINGSLQSAIMLLAPAVSGILIAVMPLGAIFFIDVSTAIIGIVILLFIKIKPYEKAQQEQKTGYYDELKAGLVYAKSNIFIKEMLILYTFYFFLITPAAFLSQVAVVRSYGEDVWRLTALEIAFSGGMTLGGAFVARLGGFKNNINVIAISCFIIGLTNGLLAVHDFYFFITMMVVMGIAGAFFYSIETTLFQEKVEPDMQGRIFSLLQIVATAVMPLGMFVFGPLGDLIKIEIIFAVSGILLVILSIYIFFNKKLQEAAKNS